MSSKNSIINPLDDEDIVQEYQDGEYDSLIDLLEEQVDEGANVICLSLESSHIDGKAYIRDTLEEICSLINIPLAFSSEDMHVLEVALRCYPGRAGVITKMKNRHDIQNLCQKYGAVLL